jgi:spore germination protein YaaH
MSMYCAPGTFPYTIQPGDSYWELADRFNVTIEAIMATNPYINPDNLLVGQVICMPEVSSPPVQTEQRGGRHGGERRGEYRGRRPEYGRRPYYPYNPYYPYDPYYPYY